MSIFAISVSTNSAAASCSLSELGADDTVQRYSPFVSMLSLPRPAC
jgi:hypothetical protein